MEFKEWLLKEMAHFTVPNNLNVQIPHNNKLEKVIAFDMRFELPPAVLDKNSGKVMNQGSKFIAKIPLTSYYLVYNGLEGILPKLVNKNKIKDLIEAGYNLLDNNWWRRALKIGNNWEPL